MPIKNPDQPNSPKKSRDTTPILKYEIENAQAHTKSNMAAARFLGVPYLRYRKYAKLYGIFDQHLNQEGWGLDKGFSKRPNSIPLRDVLAGKHPKYSIAKLKNRLIARKKLLPQCYLCGFHEQRITDKTVPLMLSFKDGNRQNYHMDNMELLCYNCMYLTTGAPSVAYRESIKKSFIGEGVKPVPKVTTRDAIPDEDELDEGIADWADDDAPFNRDDRNQWLEELETDI
jgi:hypothetical protein